MIHTRFARLEPTSWGINVWFEDGRVCPAQHHPDDPHYSVISHRTGYGDNTLRYCREHELAHLVAEEMLHCRPSRVLWGLAHHEPLSAEDAAYEECIAQALQRYARAAEQPIIGGVDWRTLRERFLELAKEI